MFSKVGVIFSLYYPPSLRLDATKLRDGEDEITNYIFGMAIFCNIGCYSELEETVSYYTEHPEANNIKDEQKANFLLGFVGAQTSTLIKDLCSLDPPKGKMFKRLIDLLRKHYSPKPGSNRQTAQILGGESRTFMSQSQLL